METGAWSIWRHITAVRALCESAVELVSFPEPFSLSLFARRVWERDTFFPYMCDTMSAAGELVTDSILSAIKKTPSQSTRATKVKLIGQEILHKAAGIPGTSTFEKFSNELMKYLQQHIRSVTSRLRSTTFIREKIVVYISHNANI